MAGTTESAHAKAEREKNEAAVKAAIESGELAPEPEAPKNEIKSLTVKLTRVGGGGQQFQGSSAPEPDEDGNEPHAPDHEHMLHLGHDAYQGLGEPQAIEITVKATKE